MEKYLSNYSSTITVEDILGIFRDLIDGFRYLQNNKILHRDIKSENILRHGNIWKIADFGCANFIQ